VLYRGASNTAWEARRFPSAAELEEVPYLEHVFHHGEADVFALRLACG
jgi:hypothetical protein